MTNAMSVQQLIDRLQAVEDKSKQVIFYNQVDLGCVDVLAVREVDDDEFFKTTVFLQSFADDTLSDIHLEIETDA